MPGAPATITLTLTKFERVSLHNYLSWLSPERGTKLSPEAMETIYDAQAALNASEIAASTPTDKETTEVVLGVRDATWIRDRYRETGGPAGNLALGLVPAMRAITGALEAHAAAEKTPA